MKSNVKNKKNKVNKQNRAAVTAAQVKNKKKEQYEKFNFDNEIVIGVNVIKNAKKDKQSKEKEKINKNKEKIRKANKAKNVKLNKEKNQIIKNKKNEKRIVRNKKIVKTFIKVFLLIILLISIIAFIMTTPLFNITSIEVSGNKKITNERIISLSQINLDVNTYQYSKKEIENNIKEEPYIESVEIKRKLPNILKINIIERETNYMLLYADSYIYINKQGYILEITNEPLDLPIIEGYTTSAENLVPGKRLEDEDLERLNTIIKITDVAYSNDILDKIKIINISDTNNYTLNLEEERKIAYLGDSTNINDKILMLKEILTKESSVAGEIFLKDLNKIYFREQI